MPPKLKLPPHLPKTWKYGNRNLKPALSESSREAYKERIITPKIEPLWSRAVHFGTYVVCAGHTYPTPRTLLMIGVLQYIVFFVDYGAHGHVLSEFRDWTDSMWAQYWYISSKDRRRVEEARAKQDERIREQERLLDERIAKRRGSGGGLQAA